MGRWRISLSCKTRSPQASWERSLLDWNKPRSSVRNASRLRALMHTTIICEGLRAFIPGRKRATTKRCGYSPKPFRRKGSRWIVDRVQETAETARLARRAAELGWDDAVALAWGGFALAYVVHD